jgi:aspartate 1-decarboxylase
MRIQLLRCKIHRATVTGGNVDYEGSLTVSRDLAETVGLRAYERILVGNMANGQRFETYTILGEPGRGDIILNGATAHLGRPGDRLTIMSFGLFDESEAERHQPRTITLGEDNRIVARS